MQQNIESSIPLIIQEQINREQDNALPADVEYPVDYRDSLELMCKRKPSSTIWRLILIAGDTFLILVLFTSFFILNPFLHVAFLVPKYTTLGLQANVVLVGIGLCSWVMAAKLTHSQMVMKASNRLRGIVNTLFALVLMLIIWIFLAYPFININAISYSTMMLFLSSSAILLSVWRVILAEIMNFPRFRLKAVIFGLSKAGETLAQELHNAKYPYADIVGYISYDTSSEVHQDGLPIIKSRSVLRHLVQSRVVDMIVMAVNYHTAPTLFEEAIDTTSLGVTVVPMEMVYEWTSGRIPVEHVGEQWYVSLPSEQTVPLLYLLWNKAVDLVFGLCGSLILLFILPVVALLIKLDSQGPIFYSQERLGYRGRKFYIHKFRSMYTDAEYAGRGKWATANDSRITRVGRFMRSTHLDELPQVFNILRGQMSLIGPRPERQEFVTELEKVVPFYRCRLSVKPGLTGWAQVKYRYGNSNADALTKLQYDLYYIKHQSFVLDIFVILHTCIEVLLQRGV